MPPVTDNVSVVVVTDDTVMGAGVPVVFGGGMPDHITNCPAAMARAAVPVLILSVVVDVAAVV